MVVGGARDDDRRRGAVTFFQRSEDARLPLQAYRSPAVRVKARRGQELERDLASERRLHRRIDDPGRAASDLVQELELVHHQSLGTGALAELQEAQDRLVPICARLPQDASSFRRTRQTSIALLLR